MNKENIPIAVHYCTIWVARYLDGASRRSISLYNILVCAKDCTVWRRYWRLCNLLRDREYGRTTTLCKSPCQNFTKSTCWEKVNCVVFVRKDFFFLLLLVFQYSGIIRGTFLSAHRTASSFSHDYYNLCNTSHRAGRHR